MDLKLETKTQKPQPNFSSQGGGILMITPPIDEEFWRYRVAVSDRQAVVGFPKFMTIGIGFQVEDADWNTNLPYTSNAEMIFQHIKHNKGDDTIPDDLCLEAIRMIQAAAEADKGTW